MRFLKIIVILFLVFFGSNYGYREKVAWAVPAGSKGKSAVKTKDSTNRKLEFFYYIPKSYVPGKKLPVLICVPGLDGSGAPFVAGRWSKFADKNKFVIVSPSFRFNAQDWKEEKSYQYPQVWSGEALFKILAKLGRSVDIYEDQLYLFGHSAGAQVVHRFALWQPKSCKAVAAHAPGGVSFPAKWIPVKFLFTVGEKDKDRKQNVIEFAKRCKQY